HLADRFEATGNIGLRRCLVGARTQVEYESQQSANHRVRRVGFKRGAATHGLDDNCVDRGTDLAQQARVTDAGFTCDVDTPASAEDCLAEHSAQLRKLALPPDQWCCRQLDLTLSTPKNTVGGLRLGLAFQLQLDGNFKLEGESGQAPRGLANQDAAQRSV